MKKLLFVLLLSVVLAGGLLWADCEGEEWVWINNYNKQETSENFYVPVYIENCPDGADSAIIRISYDNTVIDYTGNYQLGSIMGDLGWKFLTVWEGDYGEMAYVSIDNSTNGGSEVPCDGTEDGSLFALEFEIVGEECESTTLGLDDWHVRFPGGDPYWILGDCLESGSVSITGLGC